MVVGGSNINNINSFDTEDPVIGGTEQPKRRKFCNDGAGAPQIGRNFYINHDDHNWQRFSSAFDSSSLGNLSSLDSGGITTISQVVGERYGGLEIHDVENAGGDANYNDGDTTIGKLMSLLTLFHLLNR